VLVESNGAWKGQMAPSTGVGVAGGDGPLFSRDGGVSSRMRGDAVTTETRAVAGGDNEELLHQ